jgi:MFS family permease
MDDQAIEMSVQQDTSEHIDVEVPRDEQTGLLHQVGKKTYVESNISARMDRLPWSSWHTLIAVSLGISWIMDGLIVSSLSLVGSKLLAPDTLALTPGEVGWSGTTYLIGAVLGALIFGYLADRYGRQRLFIVTPTIYLLASQGAAFSWDFWSFIACTFVIGLGIGGEYSAMNSAINEFIPAKIRGTVDLAINGSYWLGVGMGCGLSLIFLRDDLFEPRLGWRFPFSVASVLGISIIVLRLKLPESPRWLVMHGRIAEAEKLVSSIEERIERSGHVLTAVSTQHRLPLLTGSVGFGAVIGKVFRRYKRRSLLSLVLVAAQAFFYNAVFFSYAPVLTASYGVSPSHVGLYELPFALGNFLGSVLLGPLFDKWGRRPMISITYLLSAVLLTATGWMYASDMLTAVTQTVCWSVIFFISSASASSAYLTVSEIFPMEIRALSIAFFYALGTGLGGTAGPVLFGHLIGTGSRMNLFWGYVAASVLMFLAAVCAVAFGVKAEGKTLEELHDPDTEDENALFDDDDENVAA